MVITCVRTYFSTRLVEITTQPAHSSNIYTKYQFSSLLVRFEFDLARNAFAVLLRSKWRCTENRYIHGLFLLTCIYRDGTQLISYAVLVVIPWVKIGASFIYVLFTGIEEEMYSCRCCQYC